MSVLLPCMRRMCVRGRVRRLVSYQALNLVSQIRLLGAALIPHKNRKEFLIMNELLFFIIGTALGSLTGVVLMCLLQINRLSKREEVENAKTKCAGTVPLE